MFRRRMITYINFVCTLRMPLKNIDNYTLGTFVSYRVHMMLGVIKLGTLTYLHHSNLLLCMLNASD